MILVIGPAASGKLAYVRSLGYADEQIADGRLALGPDGRLGPEPVVANLQDIVAADPQGAPALLEELAAKEVVTCDEVGGGIIPLDAHDREAREATGRLCIELAAQAEQVVRLTAGIPTRIK